MYSTYQRANHLLSLSTTCAMILLALVAVASWASLPAVAPGRVEIKDLIVKRGRLRVPYAREEDLASLRFDVHADLQPLLEAYNTKQLFLYLVASYASADEVLSTSAASAKAVAGLGKQAHEHASDHHEVVLWDRIVTRSDARDIRSVGQRVRGAKGKARGKVRVEEARSKYVWREPSGSFAHVASANFTLRYSLMPYVGIVSQGVAATAAGPLAIPAAAGR
ncbi:Signal peptidase complex subunit [Cryptotrichosporon argae]